MAKQETKMAAEAKRLTEEQKANRAYIAKEEAWKAGGEEFGGKSEILLLDPGEVAGPITYIGHQQMTTELGETTVHLGSIGEETLRLPIQATFLRAIDQAGLNRGDTFLVRREEDQLKKQGKGKGQPMAIYAIKVIKRVPAAPAVS